MRASYFFSFRSPYSWLASIGLKNRIEKGEEFELIPFWEPDAQSLILLQEKGGEFPYRQMSDAKHRYILHDIRRLTIKFGLQIKWPVDHEPWWELSHLGYLKANSLGYGDCYFWQVYRTRWEEGLDISKPNVISQACLDAGIPKDIAEEIVGAPKDKGTRELGAEVLYRIYCEDVFGVPMFTKKRDQYWGLDRLNDFLAAIDQPVLSSEELPMTRSYPLDFDHAGGCG